MSTSYHVYMNNGLGGPVDYGTVIATTASLTWLSGALTYPGDYLFAVRAFDTVTGYEDINVDAIYHLVLDAAGTDITNVPNAPLSVMATPTAGGGVIVHWNYGPSQNPPTGFKVWINAGASPTYAGSPAITVPYLSGYRSFYGTISGLSDATLYTVSVRAYNATGTETNTDAIASFTAKTTGPGAVDSSASSTGF